MLHVVFQNIFRIILRDICNKIVGNLSSLGCMPLEIRTQKRCSHHLRKFSNGIRLVLNYNSKMLSIVSWKAFKRDVSRLKLEFVLWKMCHNSRWDECCFSHLSLGRVLVICTKSALIYTNQY